MLVSRTLAARPSGEGGLRLSALRTERSIALIRVTVLSVVVAVYLSGIGIRGSLGPSALVILVLAVVYAFACLIAFASDESVSMRTQIVTLLVDVGLITLWISATGGGRSQFWTLYLIVVLSVALRFGMVETLGVAAGLAILHVSVLMGAVGIEHAELVYRPTLLVVTGFAVGVLSHQRGLQRRESRALQALAETRADQLGKERAEVARLRRVDLARSEFVAVAAHEFRSPLAAILGVLSTMKTHGDTLAPRVRDELIDGASGTRGRLHVELDRADLVVCDVDALIRVLTNLLDNARKYSPEGTEIVLSVSQDEERVCFTVRDAGPGVPPQEREAIFERFRRADGSGKPGAGLGLYISRGLVQAHGGELTVGDAPGGGAEFVFWLPRRLPGMHEVAVGPPNEEREDELPDLDVSQVTAATGGTR